MSKFHEVSNCFGLSNCRILADCPVFVWLGSRSNFVLKFLQVVGIILIKVVSKFRSISNCFDLSFSRNSVLSLLGSIFAGCLGLCFVEFYKVLLSLAFILTRPVFVLFYDE